MKVKTKDMFWLVHHRFLPRAGFRVVLLYWFIIFSKGMPPLPPISIVKMKMESMPSSHKTKLLGLQSQWFISRFSREFLPHPFGGDQWMIKAPTVMHMLVLKSWCCWVLSVMDLRCMLQLIKRRLSFLPGYFQALLPLPFPQSPQAHQTQPKTHGKTHGDLHQANAQPQPGDTLQMTGDLDGYGCYAGAISRGWFASCCMWIHFF